MRATPLNFRRSVNRTLLSFLSSVAAGSAVAAFVFLATLIPVCADGAAGDAQLAGRPLGEVLEEFREAGLNLIYSSDVVTEELLVREEPRSAGLRERLEEILATLGLAVQPGPAGSLLVVREPAASAACALAGTVVGLGTSVPIGSALVTVLGTDRSASTAPDGSFLIENLDAGDYRIRVEAVGYRSPAALSVSLKTRSRVELVVELEARGPYLAEVEVTPGRLSILVEEPPGALSVSAEDVVFAPTFGGDVSRVVELLPGVAAPDNSAAFNVRGGTARDVAIILDGLELYEPFHLKSLQSPFSLVDADLVERIDFFGGGFTAELGDRHGGVVRMTTAAVPDAPSTELELGTLNSRLAHAGLFPDGRGVWSAAARSWYPQALRDTIELGETGLSPRFQDAYVTLSRPAGRRSRLSAHALLARDSVDYSEPRGEGLEQVTTLNRSAYVWLRALTRWSAALSSHAVLSLGRIDRRRDGVSDPEDEPLVVRDHRTVDFLGVRHDTTWIASDALLLKAGLDVRWLGADYDYARELEATPGDTLDVRISPDGTSIAAYAASRIRITPRLAAELGLRWDHQSYTSDNQFSPRVNAIWQIDDRTRLRLGVGRYFQSQRIHELEIEDGISSFRAAELSRQVLLTLQHELSSGPEFRVDAYYKRYTRVQPRYENLFNPVELFPETEEDRVLVAPERADARGVELLLKSPPESRITWWLSYTLSAAEDVIDGQDVPRKWDQTHAGRFLLGYRWGENWSISLSGTAHTGWPTTPVTGELVTLPDGSMEIERILGLRNSRRFETYARLDVKASRTFPLRRGVLRVDLEIVNLTNRKNECCVDEDLLTERPDGTVRTERLVDSWLGVTPSVSLSWSF